MNKLIIVLPVFGLIACNPQLNNRSGITVDKAFDSQYLINSRNSLLSQDLAKVPGRICRLDKQGQCINITPSQCLVEKSSVEVKPELNPSSMYHSLITSSYKGDLNVPFISATGSSDQLAEIKASVSGTALIKANSSDNGFPGYEGIKSCLLKDYGDGDYGTVYWVSAANIVTVSTQIYNKVDGSLGVTGSGFGFGGSTYNSNSEAQQNIYIGLMSHPIEIGKINKAAQTTKTDNSVINSDNGVNKVSQPDGNVVLPPAVKVDTLPNAVDAQ